MKAENGRAVLHEHHGVPKRVAREGKVEHPIRLGLPLSRQGLIGKCYAYLKKVPDTSDELTPPMKPYTQGR